MKYYQRIKIKHATKTPFSLGRTMVAFLRTSTMVRTDAIRHDRQGRRKFPSARGPYHPLIKLSQKEAKQTEFHG